MKKIIIFIIALFSINSLIAQECKCPKNDLGAIEIDTIYKFPNGNSIALCGYRNEDQTFSEFLLADCRSNEIISSWDATETCEIYQKNNKLILEELVALPVKSKQYEIIVWNFVEIYFENNIFKLKRTLNKDLPKYTEKEIGVIIKQYQNSSNKLDDNCIILANKLFISAISGSQEARKYFLEFPNKFKGLDGAFLEDYKELDAMLGIWENNQKANKFKD